MTLAIPPATTNSLTWSGASADGLQWLYGANWVGGIAPTNPTTGTLSFDNAGLVNSATTTVTSIVTPRDFFGYADTWQVGGLRFVNTSAGSHNLHIPVGSTLWVTNALNIWNTIGSPHSGYSNLRARFTGGTLSVGAAGAPADLNVAYNTDTQRGIAGEVTATNLTAAALYLRDVILGWDVSSVQDKVIVGILDLRGSPIAGRALSMRNLSLGRGNGATSYGRIYLDDACGLTNLTITGTLGLGYGAGGGNYIGRADTQALPNGVALVFGQDAANRGSINIGLGSTGYSGSGVLKATGASVSGFLSRLRVGYTDNAGGGTGTFDMSGMTNVLLDIAGGIEVGRSTSTGPYSAVVKLPAGQVGGASNLYVGVGGSGVRSALLALDGTVITVSNVSVGASGIISNRVGGVSSGLDIQIADTNAFAIAAGGRIALVFTADPVSSNDKHWGLRMAGDQRVLLNGYLASGLIATNTAGLSAGARSRFAVYYTGGRTSIGCQPAGGSSFVFR